MNSVFSTTDSVTFVIDEITNDYDDTIKAKLYSAAGDVWVEDLGEWRGEEIAEVETFVFTWDVDVGDGKYYVRAYEIKAGEDGNDMEDLARSHTFYIKESNADQMANNKAYSAYSTNSHLVATEEAAPVVEEAAVENPQIATAAKRRKRSIYSA
jgi:hypothetical protein